MTSGPPTQAVILAGGRGNRLRPLTDTVPKPLVPIQDRPFLSYHLDQLRGQGIQEVVLLVGYLAEQIRAYCGDGSRWGLRVSYIESPLEAETGQRMRDALPRLDPYFLLMYCDNYWPMQLTRMWPAFQQSGALATVTVYANRDGYSRNNTLVNENGYIQVYDHTRSAPSLNGVEIGYAIVSRTALEYLPQGNVSFEHTVFPALVDKGLLSGYLTEHRYYSVGSHERLSLTEAFLKPQRAVILDRDGVLNQRPLRAQYICDWADFHWLAGAKEALGQLTGAGYKVLLATNQPGIARGELTAERLERIHHRMAEELSQAGAHLDAVYHCPHGWDEGCFCRKPSPGLLFEAQRDFHLDLTKTLFVGDDERDIAAGEAAGCLTALVTEERSLLSVVKDYLNNQSEWLGWQ